MPSEPGCIAPAASGGLVIALRHGVFRAREWGGPLQHIATSTTTRSTCAPMTASATRWGASGLARMDETQAARKAALYSLDCRAGAAPQVERKLDQTGCRHDRQRPGLEPG